MVAVGGVLMFGVPVRKRRMHSLGRGPEMFTSKHSSLLA